MRRSPVALDGLDESDRHTHVSITGHVDEMREGRDLADIDRLARQYTGKPYPQRDRGRISAWIAVDGQGKGRQPVRPRPGRTRSASPFSPRRWPLGARFRVADEAPEASNFRPQTLNGTQPGSLRRPQALSSGSTLTKAEV